MAKGKFRLKNSIQQIDLFKQDIQVETPATLGVAISGSKRVQVPGRDGYVYARIRGNLSELVQAYNGTVAPVFDLPVILIRDPNNKTRWLVKGRDLGRYSDWGSTPYLPFHGATHSFDPSTPGGDPVWVWGRQFMPLAATPSGSAGGPNVIIEEGTYYSENSWHFAGGTGTANLLPTYKPTGSNARMVLVYLDGDGNPGLVGGTTYFSVTITGTADVVPYLPTLPNVDAIPIAGVWLGSGTSVIVWNNIYDLRPFIVGDSFIATGVAAHTIQDDGVSLPPQTYLNFIGGGFVVYDNGGKTNVSGTASGNAETYTAWRIPYSGADGILTTNQYWSVTGNTVMFGVDKFVQDTVTQPTDFRVIIGGDPDGASPLALVGSYDTNAMPGLYSYCWNGAATAPTPILNGDKIYEQLNLGFDSSNEFQDGFQLLINAEENWSASAIGTIAYFSIVNTGSTTLNNALIMRSYRSTFARDIVLLQTGTSSGAYFGNPDVDGSYRLTQKNDTITTQKRVAGVWTDIASGHTIQDDGVSQTTRSKLNFVGPNFVLYDDPTNGATIVSGTNAVAGCNAFVGDVLLDQIVSATGTVSSFSLSDIPSGYLTLEISIFGRSARTSATVDGLALYFNGDVTGTNYQRQQLRGQDTTTTVGESVTDSFILVMAASQNDDMSGGGRIWIPDPSNTNLRKVAHSSNYQRSAVGQAQIETRGIQWNNVAAITAITLSLDSGDYFVYGTRCIIIGYKNRFIGYNDAVTVKTSGYTEGTADKTIIGNSGVSFNVTLRPATGTRRELNIKNMNTGTVTVVPDGSDTIDDGASVALLQYENTTILDYAVGKWCKI